MGIAESSLSGVYVGVGSVGDTDTEEASLTYDTMRVTAGTLSPQQQTTQSGEINPLRKAPDSIRTGASGSGDISIEFSAKSFDRALCAALMNENGGDGAWQVQKQLAQSMTLSVNGELTTAGTDWTTAENVRPGSTITLGSDYVANNQGNWMVSEVIDEKTVRLARTTVFTVEATPIPTGADAALLQPQTFISTNKVPLWVEREFSDGVSSPMYTEWYGYGANTDLAVDVHTLASTLALSFTPGSISTGTLGYSGAFPWIVDGTPATKQRNGGSPSDNPIEGTIPINGMDDVTSILLSKTDASGYATPGDVDQFAGLTSEISFNLNNNIREDQAVGTFGTTNVGLGTPSLTGTLAAYLQDKSVLDHMVAFNELFLGMQIVDAADNYYAIGFGQMRFDNASTPVSGNNAAVLANGSFNARDLCISQILVA